MGAALILSTLGVERDLILKDYAVTDVYWKQGREMVTRMMQQPGGDTKQLNRLMAADPAYLNQFFAAIDQKYGSMNNFLETEMELSPTRIAALLSKFLN
jgi:protein-tyrosine phosphatase